MVTVETQTRKNKVILSQVPEIITNLLSSNKLWPIYKKDLQSTNWQGIDYLVEAIPSRRGGMNLVYKAWNFKDDKLAAVRELQEVWQQDQMFQSSIRLEYFTLLSINHPGIPKVYGLTYDSSKGKVPSPKMIMEYIEEESLKDRLDSIKLLIPDEVVEIVNQVGQTIDYLDLQHHLFHGDIKPSQIRLRKPHILLTDFGVSNAVFTKDDRSVPSTPNFAAPERQLHGIRNLATEEFSLAATAYNMISGNNINLNINDFQNPKVEFSKISKRNLKYDLDDESIKELNKIFKKALATKPKDRYESATAFADAFANIMKNAKGPNQSFRHKAHQVFKQFTQV